MADAGAVELTGKPDALVSALRRISCNSDMATEIAGGSYAVLRHKGPYADMRAAYRWLYGTWLLQSGREIADRLGVTKQTVHRKHGRRAGRP